MVKCVKVLAANHQELSLTPRTHMAKKIESCKISVLCSPHVACKFASTDSHTQKHTLTHALPSPIPQINKFSKIIFKMNNMGGR